MEEELWLSEAIRSGSNSPERTFKRRYRNIYINDETNIQKLHDYIKHPSVHLMGKILSDNHLNIPKWRIKYKQIRMNCENCIRRRYNKPTRSDYDKITPERINQEWSLDIAGPLYPKTKTGNKYF